MKPNYRLEHTWKKEIKYYVLSETIAGIARKTSKLFICHQSPSPQTPSYPLILYALGKTDGTVFRQFQQYSRFSVSSPCYLPLYPLVSSCLCPLDPYYNSFDSTIFLTVQQFWQLYIPSQMNFLANQMTALAALANLKLHLININQIP